MAEFSGYFNAALTPAATARGVKRSGYAGFITREDFGDMDLDDYDSLVFRLKGDGRQYLASLRTSNWTVGDDKSKDVWQAFLPSLKGEWADVEIPFEDFSLTYKGRVVPGDHELNATRILSVAVTLAGGEHEAEGPFKLVLDYIAAQDRRRILDGL